MIRAGFHVREGTLEPGTVNGQHAYLLEFHTLHLSVRASTRFTKLPQYFLAQSLEGRLFSGGMRDCQRPVPRQKIECAASVYGDHCSPAILLPLPGDGAVFVMEFVHLFGLEIRINAVSSTRRINKNVSHLHQERLW